MKYLSKKHDIGENWKLTGLMEVEDDFIAESDRYFILSKDQYDKIEDLSKNNEIYFPKNKEGFSLDHIVLEEVDPLFYKKYKVKNSLTNSFKKQFSDEDFFNFLKFVSLTTELADKGFYFHPSNLDVKLEEIKNLNNIKLLENAEDLVSIIKSIEPHMDSFSNLIKLRKEIDKCSNEEQIYDLLKGHF